MELFSAVNLRNWKKDGGDVLITALRSCYGVVGGYWTSDEHNFIFASEELWRGAHLFLGGGAGERKRTFVVELKNLSS